MAIGRTRNSDDASDINITPMLDMVFIVAVSFIKHPDRHIFRSEADPAQLNWLLPRKNERSLT